MTDYKQLCAELTEALHRYQCWYIEDNGASLSHLEELLRRAEATLAKPEPEGPTDEELREIWNEGWDTSEEYGAFKFARAVLARWGK